VSVGCARAGCVRRRRYVPAVNGLCAGTAGARRLHRGRAPGCRERGFLHLVRGAF
jgi:hypothetical protein